GRRVAGARQPPADGAGGPGGVGGEPVPLHGLPQHRRGRPRRRGRGEPVIPAPFDYVRAESSGHALEALAQHGDEAKLLAGGPSLLPLMKLRLATPAVLVDVGRLDDLAYIREDGDEIAIGALTRHRALETSELLARDVPLLRAAAHTVGDPQVRRRGTI